MKILIDGKEIDADRVDIIHENYPEDNEDMHLKCTDEGIIVDIIEDNEVARTSYFLLDDLAERAF